MRVGREVAGEGARDGRERERGERDGRERERVREMGGRGRG